MPMLTASQWDEFVRARPDVHLLQSLAWGEAKAGFGWQPAWACAGSTGAQILFRQLPLGLTIAYLPKGPVGPDWAGLWPAVHEICRRRRAIFLKVEPDLWQPARVDAAQTLPGFRPADPIQPGSTVLVSLDGEESDWLGRMKQKTRYNIRLAERKGVQVRESADVATFYRLMQLTGERDGFGIHTQAYYQQALDGFAARGQAALLMASYQDQPLAGLMVFAQGDRAYYLYGASSELERNRMPTYLLQWEAMRWAAARGCRSYDLYGVPDGNEEELEQGFTERSDGLWGVYRFKRGFGGQLVHSVGAWDYVYQPLIYRLYCWYARRRREAA